MKTKDFRTTGPWYAAFFIFSFVLISPAFSQELDCLKCHAKLANEKVKHAALDMGCPTCHTSIIANTGKDAKKKPHKNSGTVPKGLSADQPDLCYGCHDKATFSKKTVHAAVSMGCTGCHNPHSSKNAKLLKSEPPELCYGCHEKGLFNQKTIHAALGMGCLTCHTPHSGDKAKLLLNDPPDLCYGCHDKTPFAKKVVHPALDMGCPSCHNPHSSKNAKLLKSEQPVLCYECHDKGMFTKKVVHAAIDMGCTGCHTPHSGENAKLLISAPPELCFSCHDKAEFSKKNIHPPVLSGLCLKCHGPHSSDSMALLNKPPVDLCLECHGAVEKKPHVIAGINNAGHPLGKKEKKDPKRPDKQFYCGGCHNPHSSDSMKLFRYPAKATMGLCVNCHKFGGK